MDFYYFTCKMLSKQSLVGLVRMGMDVGRVLKVLLTGVLFCWIGLSIGYLSWSIHNQYEMKMKLNEHHSQHLVLSQLFARQFSFTSNSTLNASSISNDTVVAAVNGTSFRNITSPSEVRVACFVMTTEGSKARMAVAIIDKTWGTHCDKLVFVASEPVPGVQAETLIVERIPDESSVNLYRKVVNMWKKVYEKYKNEADWFIRADDDTFIVMRNFKQYVFDEFTKNQTKPRFLGRRMKLLGNPDDTFNQGGASYALNSAGLESLHQGFEKGWGWCYGSGGAEDVALAGCLKQENVIPEDTRDEFGRERFVSHKLDDVFYGVGDNWFHQYSFNLENLEGCCSRQIISFHWLNPIDLLKYYYAFNRVE
jgi:glycoprotein-N-acetylgalactosamine 3-beta-galactosyltransferase